MYKQWLVLAYLEIPAEFPMASTCLQLSVTNHATAHTLNVACNTISNHQTFMGDKITLEDISNLISIATPFILLIWFYYSQRQTLSKDYFSELNGIYAGFTEPISKVEDKKGLHAGIILNIRETDDKGYFKGQFDFAETITETSGNRVGFRKIRHGIHTFIGKMEFEVHRDKIRHPFKPDQNRTYKGKLYIVDRLDFLFENYKIEDYLSAEYDIKHYREMGTFVFTISKVHRQDRHDLPPKFTLFKKMGAVFEPYSNVKQVVFVENTLSDI